ncbi:lipopolysaccharide export system protein LptA [Chitiniphilus shinanonensis]|uniref:Lipopolysaccharide export system protein LptA n=1 Tax=Chitiniphilus shinanonensis TaxID=553088 RepID=A0ABQ6BSP1_9NEIS|nr:lipopolysaccharide transport periplasmic protein LptA [Chitiniphilus shinanonensis]GLS04806.1 lipopolysaccharide export system protein LptA [Chitiniphilus shinanonensis]
MYRLALSLTVLGLIAGTAQAETADREKPMNIEADRATYDQKQSLGTYTGNVIVTQGTMTLKSAYLTVRQDPEGNQFATGNGNPVDFKQRMDAGEWVMAKSQRFDYDGKAGILKLMDKAWVRRDTGDEVIGDVIIYNLNTETYEAQGGTSGGKPGRVNITIQPKKKEAQ